MNGSALGIRPPEVALAAVAVACLELTRKMAQEERYSEDDDDSDVQPHVRLLVQVVTSPPPSGSPAWTLTALQDKARAICLPLMAAKIMDAVLDMLEALRESVDGLVVIFKGLKDELAVADQPDRRSLAGRTMRRLSVQFDALSFEGTCGLWEVAKKWAEQQMDLLNAGPGKADDMEMDDMDMDDEGSEDCQAEEGSLHTTVKLSSSSCALENPSPPPAEAAAGGGGMVHSSLSADVKATMERLLTGDLDDQLSLDCLQKLKSGKDAPAAMLSYLEAYRYRHQKDVTGCINSIHRQYDYSAGRSLMAPTDMYAFEFGGYVDKINSKIAHHQGPQPSRFQAGMLDLATFHAEMGHTKEAEKMLSECIQVSQRNADEETLVNAMVLMCGMLINGNQSLDKTLGLQIDVPGAQVDMNSGGKRQAWLQSIMDACKQRASNAELPHAAASIHLCVAMVEMNHLRVSATAQGNEARVECQRVWEALDAAEQICYRAPVDGLGMLPIDSANRMAMSEPYTKTLHQIAHKQALVRAYAWTLFGHASLAKFHTRALLSVPYSSAEDWALAVARECLDCCLSRGEDPALRLLQSLAQQDQRGKDSSASRILRQAELQIQIESALIRHDVKSATKCFTAMKGLLSSLGRGLDMDTQTLLQMNHIRIAIAREDYVTAYEHSHKLFRSCYQQSQPTRCAEIMLYFTRLFRLCGASLKGVPYALAGISLCESLCLDILYAEILLEFALIWIEISTKDSEKVIVWLEEALPVVLGHGNQFQISRYFLCLAQAILSSMSSAELQAAPDQVLSHLTEAITGFQALQSRANERKALLLRAAVHDSTGNTADRDADLALYQSICA